MTPLGCSFEANRAYPPVKLFQETTIINQTTTKIDLIVIVYLYFNDQLGHDEIKPNKAGCFTITKPLFDLSPYGKVFMNGFQRGEPGEPPIPVHEAMVSFDALFSKQEHLFLG